MKRTHVKLSLSYTPPTVTPDLVSESPNTTTTTTTTTTTSSGSSSDKAHQGATTTTAQRLERQDSVELQAKRLLESGTITQQE